MMDDYLGDGVYASFDGFGLTLDLRGQDDTTRIVLEPQVFDALVRYKARVSKVLAGHVRGGDCQCEFCQETRRLQLERGDGS